MRAYNVAAVAEALELNAKQLDNLLSRHDIAGVRRGRQGVSRRLSPESVVVIRVAIELTRTFRAPIDAALAVADQCVRSGDGVLHLSDFLTLQTDLARVRADTAERLSVAVESVVSRPRGRPSSRSPTQASP